MGGEMGAVRAPFSPLDGELKQSHSFARGRALWAFATTPSRGSRPVASSVRSARVLVSLSVTTHLPLRGDGGGESAERMSCGSWLWSWVPTSVPPTYVYVRGGMAGAPGLYGP